jgi:hypothetical protein
MTISHWIVLGMRNVSNKFLENIKTHILCSAAFPENRAVCEIMSTKLVEPEIPQAIWPRWISEGTCARAHDRTRTPTPTCMHSPTRVHTHTHTHTHTEGERERERERYVILIPFRRQVVSWTRLIVTLYVYCLSCDCLLWRICLFVGMCNLLCLVWIEIRLRVFQGGVRGKVFGTIVRGWR